MRLTASLFALTFAVAAAAHAQVLGSGMPGSPSSPPAPASQVDSMEQPGSAPTFGTGASGAPSPQPAEDEREAGLSPAMEPLAWLIGKWSVRDEYEDGTSARMKVHARVGPGGHSIVVDLTSLDAAAGAPSSHEIILWDPAEKAYRVVVASASAAVLFTGTGLVDDSTFTSRRSAIIDGKRVSTESVFRRISKTRVDATVETVTEGRRSAVLVRRSQVRSES